MTTGERIRKARKNAGLSQKELGQKLGVSQVMIAQYENGVRHPKMDMVCKIADALDVLASDLLSGNIFIPIGEPNNDQNAARKQEEKELDFLNRIDTLGKQLNDAGQEKAIEQVELLTEIPKYRKPDQD